MKVGVKMNELLFLIGVLSFAAASALVVSLMIDGYYGLIRLYNRHRFKRIDILYRVGMVESANILHTHLLKYNRR